MTRKAGRFWGFSLVELVVVIVIIGILAAIAIPRLSRGASGASQSAVTANLATMRSAITLYAAEHRNVFPGPDPNTFIQQLTKYTDLTGGVASARDATHVYGPYVLAIPACPVGENAGKTTANQVLVVTSSPPAPNASGGEGWVYNATTGEFLPNTTQKDESGKAYNEY